MAKFQLSMVNLNFKKNSKGFTQSLENGFAFVKRGKAIKPFFSAGFTLVELIVAVSLFALVASISLGAVVSIFDANRRAQSAKSVVDNLNLAIENMARTVRFGSRYHCSSGTYTVPADCSSGATILAVLFNGNTVVYRLSGTALERSDNGGSTYMKITAPEAKIQYLRFYVLGTGTGSNTAQPYVVAVIKGYVGKKPTAQSMFSIETMMSQRKLDL